MELSIFILIFTVAIIVRVWIFVARNNKIDINNVIDEDKDIFDIFKKWAANANSNALLNKLDSRRHALNKAKPFLKSYNDPTGELCLANENCKVNLMKEGNKTKIVCISKTIKRNNTRNILTATASRAYESFYNVAFNDVVDNVFDLICENFTYTTVYENVFSALTTAMLDVKESVVVVPTQKNKTQSVYDKITNTQIRTNNLLNINTASEAELSALPGVNIVTAKKIIKYIEKNGGFQSVEEFIKKMKIKEVFAEQIRGVICTKIEDTKIQSKDNNKDNSVTESETDYIPHSDSERIIDL